MGPCVAGLNLKLKAHERFKRFQITMSDDSSDVQYVPPRKRKSQGTSQAGKEAKARRISPMPSPSLFSSEVKDQAECEETLKPLPMEYGSGTPPLAEGSQVKDTLPTATNTVDTEIPAPIEEAKDDLLSGTATPDWNTISVASMLAMGDEDSPFANHGQFVIWKDQIVAGLHKKAATTLVKGPVTMDYAYKVLGVSPVPQLLLKGCYEHYGRARPVTEHPLPVLWKLVLSLPRRAMEAFRSLRITPCSSGAEFFILMFGYKNAWNRMLQTFLEEDLTLGEEKVAMAYCLLEIAMAAMETVHLQKEARSSAGQTDRYILQSLALQAIWAEYWEKQPVVEVVVLKKWKQYKPRDLAKLEPMTMAKLEAELRKRWLEKIVAIFVPYKDSVPHLKALENSVNFYQDAYDLFGDAQWRTLRTHCNRLLSVLSLVYPKGKAQEARSSKPLVYPPGGKDAILAIPWNGEQIRDLMSELEALQSTPAKLEGVWGTLKYFSKILGLLNPEDFSTLTKKKDAVMDRLVPAVTQEVQQATIPSADMLVGIEEAIATGLDQHGNPIPAGCIWMLIILRLLTGASARWSDLMHTSPGSFVETPEALEFIPWRTKTVKKSKRKKKQTILIIPKVCFSEFCGNKRKYDWVPVAVEYLKFFREHEAFADMDYMFPALTKDLKAFIPRPCSDSMALRVIHESLQKAGVPKDQALEMSFHGWRALINEWGFQKLIPKSTRVFLGNWGSEEMTDTYTRQKRKAVMSIWQQVLTEVRDSPDSIDTSSRNLISDPTHSSWDDSNLGKAWQTSSEQTKEATKAKEARSSAASKPHLQGLLGLRDPEDPALESALSVHVATRNSGTKANPSYKVHLLDASGLEIGNGWRPDSDKVQPLSKADWEQEPDKYKFCGNCFKCFSLPGSWFVTPEEAGTLSPGSPGLADESGSEEASNDTASETEAVAPTIF